MIPLAIFLLACAAVYLGVIDAGFSALMRLSLRLVAERSNRPGAIGEYLDDPLLLFIPVRLLIGIVTGIATALLARVVGVESAHTLALMIAAVGLFVVVFEVLLPLLVAGRDPERVLEVLLPTFAPIARALGPMTRWIARSVASTRRSPQATPDEAASRYADVEGRWRAYGCVFEAAAAALGRGRCLRVLGRDDEAATSFADARVGFDELGARPWVARTDAAST